MTDNTQKITHLLSAQIPDYVQEFYPLFVIFVTKYFEYLQDSSTGVQTTLQNLQLNRDIDTTASDLAAQFLHTYLPNLPDNSAADPTVLIKYFRQFYQLKGSPESFRLFFKAFFDDNIEVQYPRNYLFKTSDGDWYNEHSLRVQTLSGDPFNLKHTYVTGNTSGAYSIINDVILLNAAGGTNLYDLILQPALFYGAFTTGETITGIYYDYANNLSSLVTVTAQSAVNTAPGRYLNSNSQLSNDQLLQDSLYYQQFSYVLRTHTDSINWHDTVLNELHPTGLVLFNDYIDNNIADFATSNTTSIGIYSQVSSSIKIPVQKTYLTSPTFTFDRTGDEQTGTSTTQLATTTGFATITYTSIGDITRDSTYDYPGLNITWALQKFNDGYTVTELIASDGPSFDKYSRAVGLDEELTTWPRDVNTSIVTTRTTRVSSALTAGTLLTSFSSQTLRYNSALTNATSVGSMILLVTWTKNSAGNNAKGESSNAVVISFSSNVAVIPYFGDETQRNFRYIAKNDSLSYAKLTYFHSSNSIQSTITPDISFTSTAISGRAGNIIFKPYNWERGLSYDRATIRFEIDKSLQLNTSILETFNTDNVTATGLISSWGGTTASSIRFTSTATTFYTFSSNAFIFNGTSTQTRFLQTTSFTNCAQLNTSLRYLVGDNYNGGEIPDAAEDLEIQYKLGAGTTWFTAHKLWIGSTSNLWTYGTTSLAGLVYVQVSSNTVTGFGTLFGTTLQIGNIITINSSLTTAYTITNIINNNVLQVTPAFVDNFLGIVSSTGTISGGTGGSSISGNGTLFTTQFVLGDRIAITSASTTTAYTITNIASDTSISISPALVDTFSSSILYKIAGVAAFAKLPAANQFNQTSVTVYGPGPTTSVVMRIIQNSQTTLNDDVYAVDDLTVQSFNYQATTGIVNISVAVSSGATLNISDTDFFTVTTIGT